MKLSDSTIESDLEYWYREVYSLIMRHQDPITGLFAASDIQQHAWVRDNVYTALAPWALSLAYTKHSPNHPHIYLLQQSCVKMMRGLLFCMMRQHAKVEKFKTSHSTSDSLHAKYCAQTGSTVVSDTDWGHLQLDATSLYLLILAQMTASGLQIVFNLDEVAFVQNLVFYIESAYCIPDYGIWERGDKANHGLPELNATSIGMTKAALEALSGLNLFGSKGGPSSVVHVMADDAFKCHAVLQSILPRESISKEIDSGLLSVIGFPAFAVDDADLIEETRARIVSKLQGNYGCKRFLRDGYRTPREDPNRLYYEPSELKMFENIECEWPIFFIYLWILSIYMGDASSASNYERALERVLMRGSNGSALVPEMYSVDGSSAAAEAARPGSQPRHPVGRCPFLWAQSLYTIANLLHRGLVKPEDIDPVGRWKQNCPGLSKECESSDVCVQVVVLAETSDIRQKLRSEDIDVQTVEEVSNSRFSVLPARALSHLYTYLGRNSKLRLSGRRSRDVGILSTSKLYRIRDKLYAFTPQLTDQGRYYLASDSDLLIDMFKAEINFLKQTWKNTRGQPLVIVVLKSLYLDDDGKIPLAMITTMKKFKSGYISGTRVCLGHTEEFRNSCYVTDLSFVTCLDQGSPQVLKKEVEEYLEEVERSGGEGRRSGIQGLPGSRARKHSSRRISCKGAIKRTRSIVSPYPPGEGNRESFASDETANEDKLMEEESTDMSCDSTDSTVKQHSHSRSRTLSEAQYANTEVQELLMMLRDSEHVEEQGDILQYLIYTHGINMPTGTLNENGGVVTLKDLLKEVYVKACLRKMWGLVRHTSGTLGKRVEDLAKAVADLIVRQKQITVGMPPMSEYTITAPLPEQELRQLIHKAYGEDHSTAMLTQEIIVYLAMFIRTEPVLFSEMLRLRIGLIIQVMAGEVCRTLKCSVGEASDYLLNLSPFDMKNLLYHIISGREFLISNLGQGNFSIVSFKSAKLSKVSLKSDVSLKDMGMCSTSDERERGQWLRRRRVDGALNKVPADFYSAIWHLLDRCEGIIIEGHLLHNNLTKEMTSGELKFALVVESALNSIPQPEYRQLIVEALAVLTLISEYQVIEAVKTVLSISAIVHSANRLFLEHQATCNGDSTLCCANLHSGGSGVCGGAVGVCQHFYDSAPSGTYGTMTYITRAVLKEVDCFPPSGSVDCHIS